VQDSSIAAERIGRYQVLEPIGGGPNGAVWRAKVFGVAGLERQFAIKRFLPEITTTSAMAQALSAAARQYGSLEHPRIARMNEFGVAQGQTYTAVELVAGLDAMRMAAEARLDGSSLSTGGVLALISQAARAVGYAHGRGLAHLGLAPTNIMVTVEGDVKITDFGILAATMPARPVEAPRLANRVPYLAPEQLAGDATSAATDVFALGAVAYELVVGHRAHKGDTPQQIAQSILAGAQPELPLPRPIVRVLQRCLARSPFERFPDARAFADALDAALRVAPVPGTRKDIGAQIKATLDRIAALNEGNMSGVLALHVGTGPVPRAEPHRESHEAIDTATSEFVRPDAPVAGPMPLVGPRLGEPSATMRDLPKPMTTVAGLAPPPIPVPPGVAGPPQPPPLSASPTPSTMLGVPPVKRAPPRVPAVIAPRKPPSVPPPPNGPRPLTAALDELDDGDLRDDTAPEPAADRDERIATIPQREPTPDLDSILPVVPASTALEPQHDEPPPPPPRPRPLMRDASTNPGIGMRPTPPPLPSPPMGSHTVMGIGGPPPPPSPPPIPKREAQTDQMSPVLAGGMQKASTKPTSEMQAHVAAAWKQDPPPSARPREGTAPPVDQMLAEMRADSSSEAPPRVRAPSSIPMPPSHAPPMVAAKKSRWPIYAAAAVVIAGGAAVAIYFATQGDDDGGGDKGSNVASGKGVEAPKPDAATAIATTKPDASEPVAPAKPDAGTVVATTKVDAGTAVVPAKIDAGTVVATAPVDAGVAPKQPDPGKVTPSGDSWSIASSPAGARVFVDGSDQGVTPVKLPGSADRHNVAFLLAGHELFMQEHVEGHGILSPSLKPVTPGGGPAGIKVIKCKDKDRYYVFVDGKPTGMTCPTERIEVQTGPHTVEVYDLHTESRKKFDIVVADTRLSFRVRIE
jgi:serine/threonine-protein kinase